MKYFFTQKSIYFGIFSNWRDACCISHVMWNLHISIFWKYNVYQQYCWDNWIVVNHAQNAYKLMLPETTWHKWRLTSHCSCTRLYFFDFSGSLRKSALDSNHNLYLVYFFYNDIILFVFHFFTFDTITFDSCSTLSLFILLMLIMPLHVSLVI